jgi:hypothetical protein
VLPDHVVMIKARTALVVRMVVDSAPGLTVEGAVVVDQLTLEELPVDRLRDLLPADGQGLDLDRRCMDRSVVKRDRSVTSVVISGSH